MATASANWVGAGYLVSEVVEFKVPVSHTPGTPGVNPEVGAVLIGTGISSTGRVWFTESNCGKVGWITPGGEVTQSRPGYGCPSRSHRRAGQTGGASVPSP
jgi:hypothetical protein